MHRQEITFHVRHLIKVKLTLEGFYQLGEQERNMAQRYFFQLFTESEMGWTTGSAIIKEMKPGIFASQIHFVSAGESGNFEWEGFYHGNVLGAINDLFDALYEELFFPEYSDSCGSYEYEDAEDEPQIPVASYRDEIAEILAPENWRGGEYIGGR